MHIAHSSIISTDAQLGAVFLLSTIILWRLMHRPGIPVALVMGLMLALTVATKLLALSLLPMMILGLTGRRWLIGREYRECGVSVRKWAAIVASIFLACIFTAWCLHAWSRLGDPESVWDISFSRWKATFDSAMDLRHENRLYYYHGTLVSCHAIIVG